MLFPLVSTDEWIVKFPGLEVENVICGCGRKGRTTRPFIDKKWVGLAMEPCLKCGDDVPAITALSRDHQVQATLSDLFRE